MKKWLVFGGVIILVMFLILFTFLYEIVSLALTKNIPISVLIGYYDLKSQYPCSSCSTTIQICKDTNENEIYIVGGGSHQGSGKDMYFDKNGQFICTSKWSFSACKGGCPEEFHKGCPEIKECSELVIEWKGKDY